MSKTLYAHCQKITDCSGRENYITSPDRQETLICSYSSVEAEYWKKLQLETEVGVNDCREIHFMLPNNLKGQQELIERYTKKIGEDFQNKYGVDYVIGCHDNPENLHCHIMFNERTVINPNATQELGSKTVQARWRVDDKYVSKKAYNQAIEEGGHECEYIPKHESVFIADRMFSNKIEYFKDKQFLEEFKQDLAITMNDIELELGSELRWQRELQEGHLAQVHVGKNVTPEIKAARESYNEYVKEHNRLYDLSLPELRNIAIEQLERFYQEVLNAAATIKERIMSMENLVHSATTNAINRFKSLGQQLDSNNEMINKLEIKHETLETKLEVKERELELKYEKQRELERELMPKHEIGGRSL